MGLSIEVLVVVTQPALIIRLWMRSISSRSSAKWMVLCWPILSLHHSFIGDLTIRFSSLHCPFTGDLTIYLSNKFRCHEFSSPTHHLFLCLLDLEKSPSGFSNCMEFKVGDFHSFSLFRCRQNFHGFNLWSWREFLGKRVCFKTPIPNPLFLCNLNYTFIDEILNFMGI